MKLKQNKIQKEKENKAPGQTDKYSEFQKAKVLVETVSKEKRSEQIRQLDSNAEFFGAFADEELKKGAVLSAIEACGLKAKVHHLLALELEGRARSLYTTDVLEMALEVHLCESNRTGSHGCSVSASAFPSYTRQPDAVRALEWEDYTSKAAAEYKREAEAHQRQADMFKTLDNPLDAEKCLLAAADACKKAEQMKEKLIPKSWRAKHLSKELSLPLPFQS